MLWRRPPALLVAETGYRVLEGRIRILKPLGRFGSHLSALVSDDKKRWTTAVRARGFQVERGLREMEGGGTFVVHFVGDLEGAAGAYCGSLETIPHVLFQFL
jgi:hypothetical protein